MNQRYLDVLKNLALLGAVDGKIEISSTDLSSKLMISQQTASRHLIYLENNRLITREMGVRKQRVGITQKGRELLEREHMLYKRIFESKNIMYLSGRIFSGMGEGKYYTSLDRYLRQFNEKLGFTPVPGTLNVEIDPLEISKLHMLKTFKGIFIKPFSTPDRSFGGVLCFPAEIDNIRCAVIMPRRTHYLDAIELISSYHLRSKLNLKDGDRVEIVVYLKEDSNGK